MIKQKQQFECRRRNGMALVAVLWTVVLLIIVVSVLGKTVRLESYISYSSTEQVQVRWAFRAGVEKAIALLNEDDVETDCEFDIWYENDADCNDIVMGNCELSFKIYDEAGKLNINTISKNQLMQLPEMDESIADSIIDWRDQNDEPQTGGAESGYYLNLDYGYPPRNGPFRTVQELLLVKDVSEQMFYGEDRNHNNELDDNERDGDERFPLDNGDSFLDKGWVEYLTCYSVSPNVDSLGDTKLNVNTADENTLVSSLSIASSQAKWIVENRNNEYGSIADLITRNAKDSASDDDLDSNNPVPLDLATFKLIAPDITITDDEQIVGRVNINTASEEVLQVLFDGNLSLAQAVIQQREVDLVGFTSVADLLDVEQMSIDDFKKYAGFCTVQSNVFRVECTVKSMSTGGIYTAVAIVDRSDDGVIVYWQQ